MHRGLWITLAASVNKATERTRSSRIVEKAETGLSGISLADGSAAVVPATHHASPVITTIDRHPCAFIRQPSTAADRSATCGCACHPMKHMGEITDIVEAVLFLESAGFVTGEILHVDGGQSAGH